MGRFSVNLITACIVANVHFLRGWLLDPILLVNTVGTLAFNTSPSLTGVAGKVHAYRRTIDDVGGASKRGHIAGLTPGGVNLVLMGLVATGGNIGRGWRVCVEAVTVSRRVWVLVMR